MGERPVVDLAGYKVVQMPDELGGNLCQRLLLDNDSPRFTIYTNPAFAVAEVTYARLATLLKLPCVQSRYGTRPHLDTPRNIPFVSVSDFEPHWELMHGFDAESCVNREEALQTYALGLLMGHVYWCDEGYLKPNGYFIKANNGQAFDAFRLDRTIANIRIDHIPEPSISSFILDTKQCGKEGRAVLRPMSELTNDQIDWILEMPTWEHEDLATSFLRQKLVRMRAYAADCLEAIQEAEEEGLVI